jgi:hypothetical protein
MGHGRPGVVKHARALSTFLGGRASATRGSNPGAGGLRISHALCVIEPDSDIRFNAVVDRVTGAESGFHADGYRDAVDVLLDHLLHLGQ